MRAVFGVRFQHLLVLALLLSMTAGVSLAAEKSPDLTPSLEIRSFDVAANQDQPVVCFTLSQTVARRPDVPLESFISVDPVVKVAAIPRNNRLCLTGFGFGSGYTVTLKTSLPGVSGSLAKNTQFRIQVPNRPPEFDFTGPSEGLLPRLGNDGLPLRSVNVPKIDIDIFRIADDDLLPARSRGPLTAKDAAAFAPSRGEQVWSGTIEPKGEPNSDTVTNIPVLKVIGALKPGVYVAVARLSGAASDPAATLPTQYFFVSDLGVATYRAADSLAVWVRSLSTANAATGVDVALIARNNREIARIRTDDNGFARLDANSLRGMGGDIPAAIHVYGQSGDFVALELEPQTASDATAAGARPGTKTLFYLDRKAYGPGATVSALMLLRTEQGNAVPKLPLAIDILRPDGSLFDTQTLGDQGAGGYDFNFKIPEQGSTGTWHITARVRDNPSPIGRTTFDVDSAPPNLSASVGADAAMLDPTQPANFAVEGQYPDGRAAPDTPGELHATIIPASMPFPAFPDFSFGLADESNSPIAVDPVRFVTDATGKASVPLKFTAPQPAMKPLEAIVGVRMFDLNGQIVEHAITIPVATQNLLLGVRPAPGAVFADQQPAHFEIIAVSPDGARQEKAGAGWEILQQDSAPSWIWEGGRLTYRPVVKDTHVAGGTLDIPANTPATLDTTLPAGRYRIEVFDPTGEAISSAHFMVGWAVPGIEAPSDGIEIKPTKPAYIPGENAEFFVKPPFEADVALVSADPRFRNLAVQHVPAAGGTMHLNLPQDSGLGMQLLATAVAPANAASPNLTRRAFSTIELTADPAAHSLDVKLDLPTAATPQSTLAILVTVGGAGDEPVFVRITAVDESDAENPAPEAGSPLAQLAEADGMGAAAADNYSRIITASGLSNGALGKSNANSDAKTLAQVRFPPIQPPLTLFSGVVSPDKTGKISVPLTLPDFAGKIRVRAIAWSASKAGQAEAALPVHYPLSADLALPERLAPDDHADLTLALDNADGPRGEYHIRLHAQGAVMLQDETELVVNLAEHERRAQPVTIQAKEAGDGAVLLSVTGPNGLAFERRLTTAVAPATQLSIRHAQVALKPGAVLTVDPAFTAGLKTESTGISLTAGAGTDFDLPGLVLDLKPKDFAAADQIVGAGTPYLAPPGVIKSLHLPGGAPAQLTAAIQSLAPYQTTDGGFSRWSSASVSDPWLSAFVADFLTRSKNGGASVPTAMFDQVLTYLGQRVAPLTSGPADQANPPPTALASAAYATKILAENGKLDLFQLRYLSDRLQPQIHEPVTAALIAASFATLGDKAGASAGFARAMALPNDTGSLAGILSDLDSQAMLTALIGESAAVAQPSMASSVAKLSAVAGGHRQFSTSEAGWLFRAVAGLPPSEGSVRVKVADQTLEQDSALSMSTSGIPAIKNLSDKPVHISLTVSGAPAPGEIKDQGFELQRSFFDTSGKPVDPANIRQYDMLVVVLSGRFTGQGETHPVIVDPLPAGWQIEAADITDPANRYPWLKDLGGVVHAQADAGKYVAVPNLTGERHEFKLAYVVRAAIKGQFALPGTLIEDSAQPTSFGRGAAGRTKVDPPS